jgi:CubicO group peptidase (beta-lactamase class C family)
MAERGATEYLDAMESDPVRMGWMVGSPPPPDKLIRFADSSFSRFPCTRWSYSNMRQFLPTTVVRRADRPVRTLPRDERTDLDTVSFVPLGDHPSPDGPVTGFGVAGRGTMTWAESLLANYTDGILILHRGRIIYERYFGVLDAHKPHIAYSVTKSFVATVAATLVHEGIIDEHAIVPQYLPELASSGYADATIRHLLDMTTGLQYSEDYTDQNSSVWQFTRAGGFRPRPPGYQGPESLCDFIRTIAKEGPHGERFAYKTVNTDTLAWVLRRVTGRSASELLRERLWSKLGVEEDAYFTVDETGVEFAGGGLNLTLRDMARFGEMIRLAGRFNDQQIIPAAVVEDIRRGGNRDHFALAGYTLLPGWSYRNMWWVSHNEHGAFTARGIHGQAIYIDPAAEMVIARFASHPLGANANLDPMSLPAYHAMAKHLMRG